MRVRVVTLKSACALQHLSQAIYDMRSGAYNREMLLFASARRANERRSMRRSSVKDARRF